MGMDFLDETEVMSKNKHFLETCPPEMEDIPSVKWIGSPRRRLGCYLDGQYFSAIADTGSDINLISLECAKNNGFRIDRRREYRTRIQVVDGTQAETAGEVWISSLQLGDQGNPAHTGVFHVLPGLPCDVILGAPILAETDAFNTCSNYFRDRQETEHEGPLEFNIFTNLGRVQELISHCISKGRQKYQEERLASADISPEKQRDNEDQVEIRRRRQVNARIAILTGKEQADAIADERLRVRAYEIARLTSRSSASSPSSSTTSTL